ncbi:hypothetical protein [Tolypothrix sp. VBCCA 56010]|uniref:hypothetical protein n=1 Tax=Tolypothrix sp. VBCCA 56010 TaxID=3137731 RepID=UPI003D7D0279
MVESVRIKRQGDKETRGQGDKENSKFNTLPLSPSPPLLVSPSPPSAPLLVSPTPCLP